MTTNLTYGTSSNRLLSNAGVAISYDANGNQTGDGTRTFTYNARDRLSQVAAGATVLGSYSYNAMGQRVRKVTATQDIDYVYDLNGQLLGEYANGTLIREYVYGPGGPLAQLDGSSVLYLHTDHLGSPRAATDDNQTIVWRWEGNPFGETAANEDPDGDMTAVTVNLRFPGQYFDMETGQHYNYFRTYDPTIGRYTQSDPIGLRGGLNTYAYVGLSPMRFVDPFGLRVDPHPNGVRSRHNSVGVSIDLLVGRFTFATDGATYTPVWPYSLGVSFGTCAAPKEDPKLPDDCSEEDGKVDRDNAPSISQSGGEYNPTLFRVITYGRTLEGSDCVGLGYGIAPLFLGTGPTIRMSE